MKRNRKCPVPKCRNAVLKHQFYCTAHWVLVPQVFKDAIKKSYDEMIAATRGTSERAMAAGTLRIALAYSFAVVCERLGLEFPNDDPAPAQSLTTAVKNVLSSSKTF